MAEITKCDIHKKKIEYLCMDTNCNSETQCCMACVKTSHRECKDELIVEIEKIPDIFEFKPLESIGEINECIKNIVDKNIEKLDKCLATFNKNLDLLEKKEISEEDITPEFVRLLKNHYQTKLKDSATGELEFVPIYNNNPEDLENTKKDFEGYLNDQFEDLKESLKGLTLDIGASLDPSKFMLHSNIEMKNLGKELLFKRIEGNNDYNYFSCIYKEPLMNNIKLTISIKGINQSDPYLDIGLIDEDKFNTYTSDPIVSFASNTYSYCGTSISNLEGSYNNSKFQTGRIVYMDYQPKKGSLKFTTNDGKVSLNANNLSTAKKYYFFFTLYHKEASCTVKKD